MIDAVWKRTALMALLPAAVLAGCGDAPSGSTTAANGESLPAQAAIVTTTTEQSRTAVQKLGEPFTLGDVRVTVLSVQDPFPSVPPLEPKPGNRLLSVRYEVVSQASDSDALSHLPRAEVRDSAGVSYVSEHGRLSDVDGSRTAGGMGGARTIEANGLFEVPASATGLSIVFRSPARPGAEGIVVALD